jgi:carbonic anhydrase
MEKIYRGVRRFQSEVFPDHRDHFAALGAGQAPRLLLITCADSRIDPALLTQTQPGELFVIRNAGNLVAPYGAFASGEAATIEYGIRALGIQHVAVCGHTHCGAMAALREPESAAGLPAVEAWLEYGKPALEREEAIEGFEAPLTRTVAANVLAQLDHLRTHPSVAEAEASGDLTLHGWVYDFEAGRIFVSDDAAHFRRLDSVMREVA